MESFFIGENVKEAMVTLCIFTFKNTAFSRCPSLKTLQALAWKLQPYSMKHCKSTVHAEPVFTWLHVMLLTNGSSETTSTSTVSSLAMAVPSSRDASRQWEQRDSVHVSCLAIALSMLLAIDNGGTLQLTMLLAIDNGGTTISPILLAASTKK